MKFSFISQTGEYLQHSSTSEFYTLHWTITRDLLNHKQRYSYMVDNPPSHIVLNGQAHKWSTSLWLCFEGPLSLEHISSCCVDYNCFPTFKTSKYSLQRGI